MGYWATVSNIFGIIGTNVEPIFGARSSLRIDKRYENISRSVDGGQSFVIMSQSSRVHERPAFAKVGQRTVVTQETTASALSSCHFVFIKRNIMSMRWPQKLCSSRLPHSRHRHCSGQCWSCRWTNRDAVVRRAVPRVDTAPQSSWWLWVANRIESSRIFMWPLIIITQSIKNNCRQRRTSLW